MNTQQQQQEVVVEEAIATVGFSQVAWLLNTRERVDGELVAKHLRDIKSATSLRGKSSVLLSLALGNRVLNLQFERKNNEVRSGGIRLYVFCTASSLSF